MIMKLQLGEIHPWPGYLLHQTGRERLKILIVGAQLQPIQRVASLSPLQNRDCCRKGISLNTVLSSPNPFILSPFLTLLLLERPLTQQLKVFQSLMLPIDSEMHIVGVVLAVMWILQTFLNYLNPKHMVACIFLQMDLGAACVRDSYHRDHLGVLVEL